MSEASPTSSSPGLPPIPTKKKFPWHWVAAGAGVIVILSYLFLGIFVVQPIGAVPDGRTLIIFRRSAALNFIDSADAACQRTQGGVSLLCRMAMLGGVMQNNPILVRLPYSETLYNISTGGTRYDR